MRSEHPPLQEPQAGDVSYTIEIEQRHPWGGMKWHGNIVERRYLAGGDWPFEPCWGIGSEEMGGYWSWSRERLEKKLRRQVAKRERQRGWSREHPPIEIKVGAHG